MSTSERPSLTPVVIAEHALPSVALITVGTNSGTGFVVSADGCILTSLHLLSGAKEATVTLSDSREFSDIAIVAVAAEQDLVLLRVQATDLVPLTLGDSDTVKLGQHVVAISNPLGLGHAVSDGLVSAVREVSPELALFQISTPLAPGSSGGPLLNDAGEVIGVSRLITAKGQTLTFGVPINAVKPLLEVEERTPLDEWKWSGRIERQVPQHDLSIIDGSAPEDLELVLSRIDQAISIGAPLYNDGNTEACFRIYQATALELERRLSGCEGIKQALLDGVHRADQLSSYNAKAWAMRDAFDGLLSALERYADSSRGPELPPAPARAVPYHPLSVLEGCARQHVHQIANAIADAISVGAPLYNQGHFEACFRVYEGTILDLERKLPACAGAKRALAEGRQEAENRSSYSDKAWALRDAFDGLLDVIGRLPSTKN